MRTPPLFLLLVPLLLILAIPCPTATAHPPPLAERIRIHVSVTGHYLNGSLDIKQVSHNARNSVFVEEAPHDASVGFEVDADFPFGRYLAVGPLLSMRFSNLDAADTEFGASIDIGAAVKAGFPVLEGRGWAFLSMVGGGSFGIPTEPEHEIADPLPPAVFFGLGIGFDWQVADRIGVVAKLEWRGSWNEFQLGVAHDTVVIHGLTVANEIGMALGLTFLP
jgi:hypothetical protein